MMAQVSTSRRKVLGVGAAAAGIAVIGRFALGGAARPAATDGIRVVAGAQLAASPAAVAAVADQWQGEIGRSYQFVASSGSGSGAFLGTLAEAKALPVHGRLPAGVRQNPFSLRFTVDAAMAPATNGLFTLDRAIEGLTQIFVTRGEGAGKATVLAVFA